MNENEKSDSIKNILWGWDEKKYLENISNYLQKEFKFYDELIKIMDNIIENDFESLHKTLSIVYHNIKDRKLHVITHTNHMVYFNITAKILSGEI